MNKDQLHIIAENINSQVAACKPGAWKIRGAQEGWLPILYGKDGTVLWRGVDHIKPDKAAAIAYAKFIRDDSFIKVKDAD